MKVAASAPGKIVLLGEYAVLDGAPALVMAANRRAEVLLETGDEDSCTVHAPDVSSKAAKFSLDRDGTLHWHDVSAAVRQNFRLVAQILMSLVRQGILSVAGTPAFTATLVTMDFFQRGSGGDKNKLGLGSSAALTVAFASALAEYTGVSLPRQDPNAWLMTLLNAHRRFQDGRGSGLDIAASLYGGVIGYCVNNENKPQIEQLELPPELQLLFVWSGRSASTTRFLDGVEDSRARNPQLIKALLADMGNISLGGLQALKSGDTDGFLRTVAEYGQALKRFGDACEIPIYSPEHEHIASLAESTGVAYKPCGAGGGDMGVAFSTDDDALSRLKKRLQDSGFQSLALKVDGRGVVASSSSQ